MARAAARTGCRCRPMSARRSPPICGAGGRRATGARCSCAPGLRMRRIASGTVASTVRRACRRAGLPEIGSHRLRHTTACEMVKAGVPIVRIGQVLRHRSLQSTAIYARVDIEQLRQLAAAWPGRDRAMSALDEHAQQYSAGASRARRQARAARTTVARTDRVPRERRREHDHARTGDLLGQAARRSAPAALGGQALDRTRVRRLPAHDRPGDRDPAGGRVRRPLSAPDTVSVVPTRTSPGCSRPRGRCARR